MKHIPLMAALLVGLLFSSCASQHKKDAGRLSDAEMAALTNRINELKSKFIPVTDSITYEHWYQSKSGDVAPNEKQSLVILINVREDGTYKLMSIYVGDEFIDHDQVMLRINDTAYTTHQVNNIEQHLIKRRYPSFCIERLTFDTTNDGGVPEKIFHAHGPVTVMFFKGEQWVVKGILQDMYVQQIKNGYELSQLLKQYAAQKKLAAEQQK